MELSVVGKIVESCWVDAPSHHPLLQLDHYVVMPNHVHLLVVLTGVDPRVRGLLDRVERFGKPVPGSLGTVIRSFKAASTRAVRSALGKPFEVWHERFHDSTLRTRESIQRVRFYIDNNPSRWKQVLPPRIPARYRIEHLDNSTVLAMKCGDDEDSNDSWVRRKRR